MPTALRIGPYRIYFYSYDCDEPQHMHVDRDSASAKFWLEPSVTLAVNYGFGRRELRRIERILSEHREVLTHEWHNFCTDRNT